MITMSSPLLPFPLTDSSEVTRTILAGAVPSHWSAMLAMHSLSETVCREPSGGQSEAMKPSTPGFTVTTGASVSWTRIREPQVDWLPAPSIAAQVTEVGEGASGKIEPDAGEHCTEATPQLSVTVGAKAATAPRSTHSSVWSPGQTITGGVVSTTVTVAVHESVNPDALSVQVSVTCVVPSPNGPAGLCVQVVSLSPSLSDEPALIEALPWQLLSASTFTFWHLAIGVQSCLRVVV